MDIELQPLERNGLDAAACFHERVRAHNGDGPASSASDLGERHGLLPKQPSGRNGESRPSGNAVEGRRDLENAYPQIETEPVSRIKREMNEVVFWKVRMWMIIVFIFLFIAAVIGISLFLYTVIHEDPDETFDAASFQVPLYFNGTFQLTNQTLAEELLSPASNQSRALAAELQEKLADLYRSSPALGRYFSTAETHSFRNGSVIVEYRLKFLMPVEHKELERFTLSREMVYNVFRQFLYDQETDDPGPTDIDRVSLNML